MNATELSFKEALLERIVSLTEAIEKLPPGIEERTILEKRREKLLVKAKKRTPGNIRGNAEACAAYRFQPKGDSAFTKQISIRVTDQQFANWQSDPEKIRSIVRNLLAGKPCPD